MTLADLDIAGLTPPERLELIGRLWDALDEGAVPLSPEQREVLDERLDALERDRAEGRPLGVDWEEVRARWTRQRDP